MAERNAVLKLNCLAPLIVLISLPKNVDIHVKCGLHPSVERSELRSGMGQ